MTNSWTDIKNTDMVLVMGGNAAEAHPCGSKWVTEAKQSRGAKLVVVDPRYTRTAAVSDYYAPIRQGTDIAFLLGVINYCINNNKVQWDYVKSFTNAPVTSLGKASAIPDGPFTGYDEAKRDYDRTTWDYELGPDGYVQSDLEPSAQRLEPAEGPCRAIHARDGRAHLRYAEGQVPEGCEMIAETSSRTRTMTSDVRARMDAASKGSQNIRTMAMLQLILGNIGVRGGGMNALRGHSNIQGLTDIGLMSNLIPGYLTIPNEKEATFEQYMSTRAFKPMRPGQMSYWQNYNKFFVSFLKAMGRRGDADNKFGYDWLPKLDVAGYDILRAFELMHQGKMNLYFCQGFNLMLSLPEPGRRSRRRWAS